MAEIDAIASVLGVAGVGVRISLILNAISCEVADSAPEVQRISRGITLFSLMLKQTGAVLQTPDSVHSQEAVDVAQHIAEDAKTVFDEINGMVDRVRGKRKGADGEASSLQHRYEQCFTKSRISYLLAQLESLKLSLSVMVQILQLGSLMAATSKSDSPEVVAIKSDAIQQERLETQNTIIIRNWQISQLDDLFDGILRESAKGKQKEIEDDSDAKGAPITLVSSASSELTLVPTTPPASPSSNALTKLSLTSLGDGDLQLTAMRNGAKEMIQISSEVVDKLLERWTIWYQVREKRHARHSGSSYTASVHADPDDDLEGRPDHERYDDREDASRGYYLEGTTSDWRKPHSAAARREAAHLRQKYSTYQASVSAASSDADDSPKSNASRKRTSYRHIIDSGSESSESEHDRPLSRRQSSTTTPAERRSQTLEGPIHNHSTSQSSFKSNHSGASNSSHPGTKSSISARQTHPQQRPSATPDQNRQHHAMSSPVPLVHTGNAPNPYSNNPTPFHVSYYPPPPGPPPLMSQQQQPQVQQPPQQQQFSQYPPPPQIPYSNYYPPPPSQRYPQAPPPPAVLRTTVPNVRPGSRDGPPARSPSRLSPHASYSRSYSARYDDDRTERNYSRYDEKRRSAKYEEEKRAAKEKKMKSIKEGATKSLLGAGAIAGFLEALEGLDL